MNRRIDPDSGKIYDISDGGDLPEGVDAATLVQRADDQEEKVLARLDTFAKERDAVCSVFNDIVHTVDGNQCVAKRYEPSLLAICSCMYTSNAVFACSPCRGRDEVFAEVSAVLASVQP